MGWDGVGCAIEVHKHNSQLCDGRVVEKAMAYKESRKKIRSVKQETGEGIVKGGGRKDKME